MKHVLFLSFAFMCVCLSCTDKMEDIPGFEKIQTKSSVEGEDVQITVQWNQEKQRMEGFGIAQAGWANQLYAHHKRKEIMNLLFGEDGLDLTILRGEVFPYYSKSMGHRDFGLTADIDIPFTDPLFNEVEKNEDLMRRAQYWVTREAKMVHQVDKLIFSTWSPPTYMKTKNNVSGGSLKFRHYQDYAEYLADFCLAYTDAGFPVYAISPSNEPEYPAPWNSCIWLPGPTTIGNLVVNNLGPTLKKRGINSKIIIGENAQWSDWMLVLGSRNYVHGILDMNYRISNYDIIAAGHGYEHPITKQRIPIVPYEKAMAKGLPVWVTEVSGLDPYNISMQDGLKWAADFHRYLSDASVNAIVWWTGAIPGENNEGLILMDKDREGYRISKRYETFGNFTRYIKPGSIRIGVQRGSGLPADMHVSTFKDGDKYIIVAVNNTTDNVVSRLAIDDVQKINDMTRILTDETHRWEATQVKPVDGSFLLDVPAKSVVTFTGAIQP